VGKLEKTILWVGVVIALIALLLSLHNFVQINRNKNIIEIISETQSYIIELFDLKDFLLVDSEIIKFKTV